MVERRNEKGQKSKLTTLLPGFKLFSKVTKLGQGGLLLAVRKNMFVSSMEVTSSLDKNILSVRLAVSESLNLRIILAYGPQESEAVVIRQEFMTELSIELQNSLDNGDVPIILGDLNAKIENNNSTIVGLSSNGKLLVKLLNEFDLNVLNFSDKCEGKWTHEIRTTGEKSVLDYVLSPTLFEKSVVSMIIDEDCVFCPFSSKRNRAGLEDKVFSDHNTIILEAEIKIPKKDPTVPQTRWKITDDSKAELRSCTSVENYSPPFIPDDPQQLYDVFEAEANKLLTDTSSQIKVKNNTTGKMSKFLEIK